MSDLKLTKNKHMTFDERVEIQESLNHGMSFKAIAKRIGKDPTTISKEVKKHLAVKAEQIVRTNEDGTAAPEKCCPTLLKAPFVCNPCKKRHYNCGFKKQLYAAKKAQNEYEALRSEAREGIPLNQEEFYNTDAVISAGIKKGQHLYHILQSNNLNISKSTAYRHLHRGYLSVSKLDFPRVVKFKERRQHHEEYVPKAAKVGRTYDDFLDYINEHSISSWVEMDTVIGEIGGKAILTLDLTLCNFMVAFLLNAKTSGCITDRVCNLKESLALDGVKFGDVFPVVLILIPNKIWN